jgi:hypothetical protein
MIGTTRVTHGAQARARRLRLAGALALLCLFPSFVSAQTVEDKYRRNRERQSLFNLSSAPTTVLQVNKFQCGLINDGSTCTDVFNSPTGGGGFWPTGSPNQYMFNSGLQVVGIIPPDAGFEWAGDTVGAFFMDASGLRQHGTPVTEIYNSLDPEDFANWPDVGTFPDFPTATAFVTDTALFNDVLIGRRAASQQDSWVMYWDGDPGPTGGRDHPMGILVEQRTLAWNYPLGNENIIYFIYKFTNVTNNSLFQRLNETQFFGGANALPDAGWRIDSLYVAYDSDPDVTADFDLNYATAILPFNLGLAYEGTFFEPDFDYAPSEFFPPFFTDAPGLVGIKYLKSPVDPATGEEVGLTSFSLHTNGAPFNDPNTVQRGWRYISLNIDAGKGDPSCTFAVSEIKARRSCFLSQTFADVRFFIGSGPFSLGPGESATIAVAMYAAATVATPLIQRAASADNKPGIPSLQPGCPGNPLRPLDVAAGWIRTNVCPDDPNEPVSQFDVDVVPLSLLGRGLVAQSIFDNQFLLGFAPEQPDFHLVQGDNQVTVVWSPSATETEGDPFFVAAGDPDNALFDPNYRQFDVEGYRIYRGTTPANLQLIAQFDKKGTTLIDVTCATDPTFVTGDACEDVHEVPITSPFVQYPLGGVVRLADETTLVIDADTALAAEIEAGTALPLTDTEIPFAFVDREARNGFRYFYRVTAFDINSLASGPTSLESAGPAKSVIPRKESPNVSFAGLTSVFSGDDNVPLDPSAAVPAISSANGTFAGPMPPTNSVEAVIAPLVERLLPAFRLTATIDSVLPFGFDSGECTNGSSALGSCWRAFMTFDRDGQRTQSVLDGYTPTWGAFGEASVSEFPIGRAPIPADATAVQAFNIPEGAVSISAQVNGDFEQAIAYSSMEGQSNRRTGVEDIPTRLAAGGSRWFSGDNESVADPTALIRVGHLDGVDTVWAPIHHTRIADGSTATYPASGTMQCFGYALAFLGRAADVVFTFGGGAPTVRDITHHVNVPFKPSIQASYGFLMADANGNGAIDWEDFHYVEGAANPINSGGVCAVDEDVTVALEAAPRLVPVSTQGVAPGSIEPTGMGFGLYVNGERYIFEMSQLPANNAKWTLRTYSGFVRASTATFNTSNPASHTFTSRPRPPLIPGLKFTFEVAQATQLEGAPDLKRVHTVPDPYYAVSQFDLGPATKELKFVNLPSVATIRIYSMSGVLVDIVNHNDPTFGGQATWDLRNKSGQFVASGVYFFHVSTPEGQTHIGKFTVVNSGFAR